MSLKNKIDFAVVISAEHSNPNGDPLNGNRPRQTFDGYGEISDVCLKRKLRNRLLTMGESIFVQSDDNRNDDCRSLNARFEKAKKEQGDKIDDRIWTCEKWFDVRAFGQVFAFKEKGQKPKKGKDADTGSEGDGSDESGESSVSIGIRGPVTIQSAFSLDPIAIESMQITKSVNLKTEESNPDKKAADTMGMKHRIEKGIYVAYGSINTQLASKTGFSDEDAEKLKKALQSLFVNDASSARPEGSMSVVKVIWWKHNSPIGQYSSAKVHGILKNIIRKDGSFDAEELKNSLSDLVVELLDESVG